MDTLQARLRHRRRVMNMTQAELAERIGTGRSTIAMLENIEGRQTRSDLLASIATALEVSTDYLLFGEVAEHAH